MKLKFKLSFMMISIMMVVVAGISMLLLYESSDSTKELSIENLYRLAAQQADWWSGREDGYMRVIKTLANVMADYESMPEDTRRNRFDAMIEATLLAEPSVIGMFTIWKPNAVDGMDSQYIGRIGSTATGQYAIGYLKEYGKTEAILSSQVDATMERITGPLAKKDRIDPPHKRTMEGNEIVCVIMQTPITNRQTGEIVGGVGLMLNTGMGQTVLERTMKEYPEIVAMSMYTGNGTILGSGFPDRIGKNLTEADTVYAEHMEEVVSAVRNGENYDCRVYSAALGTNLEVVLRPIIIGDSDNKWSIMIGTTEKYMMREVTRLTRNTIVVAAIAILITAAILFVVLSSVTKPVVKVAETLKDISEGEGDLTRSITTSSKDEIGDLARYFNMTLDKIKKMVFSIKNESGVLSDIGTDLSTHMTETAAAINEITANIQSIKSRVLNQSASVSETHATMEQLVVNINRLDGLVEKQTANVSNASSAIEEMAANIQSVITTLTNNATNVHTLPEASEAGRGGLQEVASDIQEISRESEGLLEINSVMENIASQTNLLSMNAAIEAAHAGEAGKGFAVVADEIRKLAESSGEQSKTIGNVLKKIKSSIDKIMSSTETVLARFEAIDSSVKIVSDQEAQIRNAMEEQGEGSKQIVEGIMQVNEITHQVQSGSHEMLEGAKEVITESTNLEKATQEITSGMNEMASGADQINVAVNHVNEISGKNREGIGTLIKEVSRFKVE